MSDAILTFQVQLSGVMETVLKSAMYEITRLVEDSFLEEVSRSKQEVESLRQRLQWSESRRREREGGGVRSRCADCGRAAVSSEDAEDRASGPQSGAVGASALCERLSEQEWSPGMRQDTAPSSGRLPPEQHNAGETYGLYVPETESVAHGLLLAVEQRRNDPDSEPGPWTEFKLRDVDNETHGLDPSYATDPSAQTPPRPSPAEEGAGDSVPPPQCLHVKSEGGVAVKEEFDVRPVCGEEGGWDVAHTHHRRHRDSWDTGETQVEHAGHSPPAQDAMKRLQSFSDRVDSLTLQLRQQRHGPPDKNPKTNVSEVAVESRSGARDPEGGAPWGQDLLIASNDVQAHQRARVAEKPFSCVQCRKSFTQRKNLQAHLKQHAGERPHRCTQCGKSFLYLSRLKIHVLGHTGERPFSCAHCEKSFLSFYDLKVHQRNHTGEKPYSCAQCGKCFTRLSILKEHRIIHSKEKSFCCTQCGKRFARPSNLKAHLRRHVVAKPHSCTLCGKSFLYLCRLKKHQKKFHWTDGN